MSEWLKERAWKARVSSRVPGVQIPPSPHLLKDGPQTVRQHGFAGRSSFYCSPFGFRMATDFGFHSRSSSACFWIPVPIRHRQRHCGTGELHRSTEAEPPSAFVIKLGALLSCRPRWLLKRIRRSPPRNQLTRLNIRQYPSPVRSLDFTPPGADA